MLQTMQLNYSDRIPDFLQESRMQFEREAKMAMAVKLFEMNKLPSGIAAQLVGLDRVTFLLKLSDYSVPIIDMELDELEQDVENA